MKKGFRIVLVFAVVMFLVAFMSSASFAMPDNTVTESINLELVNSSNRELLKRDIINFIDLVDDDILPNISYNIYNKLNDDYDFLTKFAISFILNNYNYYDIIVSDNYIYKDDYGVEYSTNKYVSVDTIYEITNKVFGVDYYYILNHYLEVENDLIPLLKLEEYNIDMKIEDITNINDIGDYIDVYVKYEDINMYYVYRFELINDRLVINNLSIKE